MIYCRSDPFPYKSIGGGARMAHLSSDYLPSDFDVVVEGTGLIESMLAAALARCGKSVLHLDRNGFYGDLWASLMHRELDEWFQGSNPKQSKSGSDECKIFIEQPTNGVSNLIQTVHGSDVNSRGSYSLHEDNGSDKEVLQGELPEIESTPKKCDWNLDPLKRKLVYDICPKVLACRGMMVDLLTKSGCSRYVEFKAVSKVCFFQSGKVEQVPCSRADVFESKLVSMLEKRKMMKFLAFCTNFEEDIESHELEKMTFIEYLRKSDLTEKLIQYVLLCIAMTDGCVPALEGVLAAKLFLKSLGRFDNAPFLYPIFGGGEIPQAFCRYCAVFGGVYCLRRSIDALILSKTDEHLVSGITCSNGQDINCKFVVCNTSSMIKTLNFGIYTNIRISRAIILVNNPIEGTEGKLTLLTVPPFSAGPSQSHVIRLLQLDSSTNTATEGTYMVHLQCESVAPNAKQDLEAVVRLLYNIQDDSDCNVAGPQVLWSLYFNMDTCKAKQSDVHSVDLPSNLHLTSGPDSSMTYEGAVQEAEAIFRRVCPDKEFLEPPPEQGDSA